MESGAIPGEITRCLDAESGTHPSAVWLPCRGVTTTRARTRVRVSYSIHSFWSRGAIVSAKDISPPEQLPTELIARPPLDTVPELTEGTIEKAIAHGRLRHKAFEQFLQLALQTCPRPNLWMSFGDNPWPSAPECERLRREFGINVMIDPHGYTMEEGSDDKGAWFSYSLKGTFGHPFFGSLEVIGHAGSREKFFAYARDDRGEQVLKPASEVSREDIRQSCYSNMLQNGVTRLLAFRGFTWEEIERASAGVITRARATLVTFKKGGEAVAAAAAAGEWCDKLDNLIFHQLETANPQNVLKSMTAFQKKDSATGAITYDFPGYDTMAGVRASKNAEKVAEIAYSKLMKLVDDGGFKLKQLAASPAAGSPVSPSPAPPQAPSAASPKGPQQTRLGGVT
jgi:hypothetical protein